MSRSIYFFLIFAAVLIACSGKSEPVSDELLSSSPLSWEKAAADLSLSEPNNITELSDDTGTVNASYRTIVPTSYGQFILNDDGIFLSDGKTLTPKTSGIKMIHLKVLTDNGEWTYQDKCPILTDLEVCPTNDNILITADKSGVYVTQDRGSQWQFIRSPSVVTGLKSVAVLQESNTLRLFVSHAYKGIFTKLLSEKKWTNISDGLIQYGTQYEEIGDIRTIVTDTTTDIYCSTNFTPAVFKLNGDKWDRITSQAEFDVIEDLHIQSDGTYTPSKFIKPSCQPQYPQAANKQGIYLESDILRDENKLSEYIALMKNIGLNAIVFDVKDDDGNLRFNPNNDTLKSMTSVEEPIDLDGLIKTARDNNLYLIGRLVLFKDKHLYEYDNQHYAVKDKLKMHDASADTTGWQGWYMAKNRRRKSDSDPEFVKRYYKEYWCDPYSTDVWEYNCAIAKEIVSRGIDEIQFDYIRFPTDGDNLRDAVFTFYDDKHDSREGAILSFLHYIRQNVAAPLSIDVYGANGWFRTGGSTGQDIMTLARYVDVICPMYYPSHFDDDFQSQPPEEDRPYRIYYYGSLRAKHIADYQAIIRPYIQAFKLYTEYDKKYFGQRYITGQIKGVEDSLNEGWTFWDMLDDYKYVRFLAEKK